MPWCADCNRFWNEQSLSEGRTCPTCGRTLESGARTVPWHFKVLLMGFAGYMIYRIYWLIEWLPKHL